jgi:hypothetical protein
VQTRFWTLPKTLTFVVFGTRDEDQEAPDNVNY